MDIAPLGSVLQPGSTAPPAPGPGPVNSGSAAPAQVSGSVPGNTSTNGVAQTSAGQPVASKQTEPSIGQVNQAVQKINAALSSQSQGIEFSIDSSSHRIIVEVVDQQTNQVIRQYPSKEALAIADALDEDPTQPQPQGLLIKQQA